MGVKESYAQNKVLLKVFFDKLEKPEVGLESCKVIECKLIEKDLKIWEFLALFGWNFGVIRVVVSG